MYVGSSVDQQQRFTEIHNTYISTKYMIGMLLDVSTTSWQFRSRGRSDSQPS